MNFDGLVPFVFLDFYFFSRFWHLFPGDHKMFLVSMIDTVIWPMLWLHFAQSFKDAENSEVEIVSLGYLVFV